MRPLLCSYLLAAALGASSAGDGHLNPTTESAWLAHSKVTKKHEFHFKPKYGAFTPTLWRKVQMHEHTAFGKTAFGNTAFGNTAFGNSALPTKLVPNFYAVCSAPYTRNC